MTWEIVYTKRAQRDAKKLTAAGLKHNAKELLDIIRENPFHTPPRFEKLVGDLTGLIPGASIFSTAWSTKSWKSAKSSRSSACGPIMSEAAGHAAGATPDLIPDSVVKPGNPADHKALGQVVGRRDKTWFTRLIPLITHNYILLRVGNE